MTARLLRPILLVAGFVVLSKLLIEDLLGLDLGLLVTSWVDEARTGGALVLAGLLLADIIIPVPSSLIMMLSGAAFGVLRGSIVALVGSIAGEWLGFEIARAYGPRAARWIVGDEDLDRLRRLFDRHGAAAIAISRALPVMMETLSVVAGLSGMKRRSFLTASIVGTAPIVVAYAYAGAASREAGTIVPAVIIAIAVFGIAWISYRAASSS